MDQALTTTLDRGGLAFLKPEAHELFLLLEAKVKQTIGATHHQASCKLSDFERKCSMDETMTSSFYSIAYNDDNTQQIKRWCFLTLSSSISKWEFTMNAECSLKDKRPQALHPKRAYVKVWKQTQSKSLCLLSLWLSGNDFGGVGISSDLISIICFHQNQYSFLPVWMCDVCTLLFVCMWVV